MTRVVAGGGRRIQSENRQQYRRLKGYSGNRQRYDQRRRQTTHDDDTKLMWRVTGNDPCAFCTKPRGDDRPNDRDHIVPLIRGGRDHWSNITAACDACNRGRRDLDLLSFLLRRQDARQAR